VALLTGFVDIVADLTKLVFAFGVGSIQGFHHGVMQVVRMTDPGSQFPRTHRAGYRAGTSSLV
jgi:hypothetical protein